MIDNDCIYKSPYPKCTVVIVSDTNTRSPTDLVLYLRIIPDPGQSFAELYKASGLPILRFPIVLTSSYHLALQRNTLMPIEDGTYLIHSSGEDIRNFYPVAEYDGQQIATISGASNQSPTEVSWVVVLLLV